MHKTLFAAAMLLAAPALAAPVNWARASALRIQIDNLQYTPSRLVLRHGRPYTLTVHNAGRKTHDLTSDPFFASALASTSRGTVPGGKLRLRGGEARTLRLVPMQRGIFKFRSTQFGDAQLGLTGRFEVR
jgi:hypothetical protein